MIKNEDLKRISNSDRNYLATQLDGKTTIFPIDKNLKQNGQPITFVGNYNVRGQG